MNPLDKLERAELLLLFDILKDACRERLEKNLLSQAFEERLARRGQMLDRLDPRPMLKRWEPRYRKLLEVATELQANAHASQAEVLVQALSQRVRNPRQRQNKLSGASS